MNQNKKVILKVLVGSRAHGLSDDKSDYDYRSVYVLPTTEILSLNYKYKGNSCIDGKIDDTSYELGHFLNLATKCNPTILEVFKAPIIECNEDGKELRELFQYVWNSKGSLDAFIGYGLNQQKKFLDKRDNRQNKYAVAYIRTLYNLIELLSTNTWTIKIGEIKNIGYVLKKYKRGEYALGDVVNKAEEFKMKAEYAYNNYPKKETDIEKINEFLIKMRKKYW